MYFIDKQGGIHSQDANFPLPDGWAGPFLDLPGPGQAPAYDAALAARAGAALQASYTQAAQSMLDATAQSKGYDSMLSLVTYVTSTNATFQAEAIAGRAWRDAIWTEAYSILAQVQAGTLAQPTIPAFLAMLPAITWPS